MRQKEEQNERERMERESEIERERMEKENAIQLMLHEVKQREEQLERERKENAELRNQLSRAASLMTPQVI
jgi:hypothetical protein